MGFFYFIKALTFYFVALKGVGFIVDDKASLIRFGDLRSPILLLTLLGILLTMFFQIKGKAWGMIASMAITTGIWFIASLVLIPIIGYIPSCATASIIILTGSLMMMDVKKIDNSDFSNWFPAFLIIFTIPFTGSISTGMALGFIAYPIAKICSGKMKDLNAVNVIIAILFGLSLAVTAFAA